MTLTANVYGVEVGNGLYGQSDIRASFTIGRKQLTIANDTAPQVNKVTMPRCTRRTGQDKELR